MTIPVDKAVELELTGKGYNIMVQNPDQFGKFKVDLILEGSEAEKAEEYAKEYGLKVKDAISFNEDGEKRTLEGVKAITLRAKHEEGGKFPRTFIPTVNDSGEGVNDLISHGAELTAKFRVYPFGDDPTGKGRWSAGNGFQLQKVTLHKYSPFEAKSAEAATA
jgi:hypothetical protein